VEKLARSLSLVRAVALACGALLTSIAVGASAPAQPKSRLVAIGDIHGAHDAFLAILKRTNLIDAQGKWSGGRTTLVQTGDYTDRGTGVRAVMDVLMALEDQARRAGGTIVTLMGNHEVMNVIGELRDVTPEIFATFGGPKSEERRQQAWQQYAALAEAQAKVRQPVPAVYQQTREAWLAAHPPGWIEYREALGPRGDYGRWLRRKPIAAVVQGGLFMHAGINPDAAPTTVEQVVARAKQEIERLDAFHQRLVERKLALPFFTLQEVVAVAAAELEAANVRFIEAKAKGEPPNFTDPEIAILREATELLKIDSWSLLAPEGPLWFRGYATWPEAETAPKITGLLERLKLTRIVVGHTPTQTRRIVSRYDGRVFIIDTGMLATTYQGRPSALEIRDGKLFAVYEDGEQALEK
jgi:hypothetical protein